MKKITMKSLAMLMMVGALAVLSLAQNTKERVQLIAGSDTKALTRTIGPNGSVEVSFKAKAGQTVGFTAGYDFKDSDIQVYFMQTGAQDYLKESGPKAPNEVLIDETGDYNVLVRNMTRKSITTTIYLDLFSAEQMADANSNVQTESLDFTGSDMATVTKTIPGNGLMKFTFNGQKGATALVKVTAKSNNMTVVFNENENQKADTIIAVNREISRKLNQTREYTIEVINDEPNAAKFTLDVTFDLPSSVQTPVPQTATEEVRFGPRETSALLKRTIEANGEIEFSFHAKKGQMVEFSASFNVTRGLTSQDLEVSLMEPNAQDFAVSGSANKPNDYKVKTSGIHIVKVTNKSGKKVTFDFGLVID